MKKSIMITASAALFMCCTPQKESTVHLKGQLFDMGSNTVTLSYDGAASLIGNSKDITLLTDNEGKFDTILTITEPSYYRISRNTLYLTPGDDITVKITPNNQEAEFNGKGAEINNYMKYRLFPKGGSFLEGGSNVKGNYEETKELIDSLSKIRISELNSLKEATDEFKELELARIKADIANSYLSFASYAMMKERNLKTEEDYKHYADSLFKKAAIDAKPIFKESKDMPILEDLFEILGREEKTKKFQTKLIPFVKGSLKFFNQHTNVKMDEIFIVADVYELGEDNLKYGMYLFTEIFWDKIKKNREVKKAIYLDEVWRLIGVTSNKEVASFIYKIFKTIRKYGGSSVAITQDVSDLFSLEEGTYGKSILNNSEIKTFFSLEEENIKVLEKYTNLSEKEKIEIKSLKKGECLMFIGDEHILTKIEAADFEKEIIN